jgi:hypothetical protein|tara:strand:- start:161 stop:1066 length:906 start_codon:yes stop_codon:yes gene_type:complete
VTFLEEVKSLLVESQRRPIKIPDEIQKEFAKDCLSAVQKQFTDKRESEFRIRMSNIGRPLCQLQMEKKYATDSTVGYADNYNTKLRNLYGDIIEAVVVMLLRVVKVNIQGVQGKVKLKTKYFDIKGTYDIIIDDKVYDIKSASSFSFRNKFGQGFQSIANDDVFGYLPQGYLYAQSLKKNFGGWIVINKETGEMLITEPPQEDSKFKREALKRANTNIKALMKDKPFERQFELKNEKFGRNETGNKVLGTVCSYCQYKHKCWGDDIQYLPQQQSKSANPTYYWYVELNNPRQVESEESQKK